MKNIFSTVSPAIRTQLASNNKIGVFTNIESRSFTNLALKFIQARFYAEKGKVPGKMGKQEEITVKMPGFVSHDSLNEEGYFTQKAKEQLEELKRRELAKPKLTNPEKKE